eukprot:scaffold5522_cov334-Pinguiococcus_pyrenoidosus.AAC.7
MKAWVFLGFLQTTAAAVVQETPGLHQQRRRLDYHLFKKILHSEAQNELDPASATGMLLTVAAASAVPARCTTQAALADYHTTADAKSPLSSTPLQVPILPCSATRRTSSGVG